MTTPGGNILIGSDAENMQDHLKEIRLAKEITEVLDKNFPGYGWAANVDLHGGMATIHALRLSGSWGCYVKLAQFINDPYMSKIKQYGGEVLERYRVSR